MTCTYLQKVQHKGPGHLACKALRLSQIMQALLSACSTCFGCFGVGVRRAESCSASCSACCEDLPYPIERLVLNPPPPLIEAGRTGKGSAAEHHLGHFGADTRLRMYCWGPAKPLTERRH